MPDLTTTALVFLSGFCLFSAIHHFLTYFKNRHAAQLLFAGAALLGSIYPWSVLPAYHAADTAAYGSALRMQTAILLPLLIVLAWFTSHYTGYRRSKFLEFLTGAAAILWLINLTQPFSLLANGVANLHHHPTLWGDMIILGDLVPSIWFFPYYGLFVLIMLYITVAVVRQFQRGEKRPARVFLVCLFFGWAAFLNDILMDYDLYQGFYLAEWAILFIVSVMSLDLILEWRRQELFFENISNQMNDAIFVHDPDTGEVLHVNDTACQMYGEERSTLLRSGIARFIGEPPLGHEEALAHFKAAREVPQIFPWKVGRSDGTEFWVEISLRMADLGGRKRMISVGRDITERMAAEAKIRENEQKFRNIVEASPLGMHFYRLEGQDRLVFMGANAAADRILKLDHRGFEGKTIEEAFPPLKDGEVPWRYRLAAQTGVPWHNDQMDYKDGVLSGAYEVYAVQTEPNAMVAIFHDVTQRLRTEEDRRRMEARMQEAQKLESLGLLAGGIAHDFNNLLQAVRGHTEILIKSEKYKGTEKEAIEGIDAASRRAADLCRQLLAYAGKGRFTQEVLDVRQVVGEIGKVLEVGLSKKAKLEYFFEDALPPIRGDGTQIRQVFLNLMTNASEALGEGSGSIKVSVRAKVIDAGDISLEPGQYVVIEVTDTGCGMDMETQSRIFEPFFTTKFTGRGLGLAAVRGIVLAHGGALKVHSVLGKGTTMMVYLPAADGVHSVPAQVPAAVSSAGRFSGRVLLADDDNDVRLVTRRMLERLGFQVQEAINGRQAVSAVAEKKDEWAGVVLDLTMPDLDGAEAFHEIRKANPGLPVVLVSGYSPEDVASRVGGNTLFSLIQKPFNQTELESAFLGLGLVKE